MHLFGAFQLEFCVLLMAADAQRVYSDLQLLLRANSFCYLIVPQILMSFWSFLSLSTSPNATGNYGKIAVTFHMHIDVPSRISGYNLSSMTEDSVHFFFVSCIIWPFRIRINDLGYFVYSWQQQKQLDFLII